MKRRKRRIKRRKSSVGNPLRVKISELIAKYASDFINMGESTEERQSRLNGACSAWNIAVLPKSMREEALLRNIEEYERLNPGTDDVEGILHDLRILVNKKLQMFPDVKTVILDAKIEPISTTEYQIIVTLTDNPDQLVKGMLTKPPSKAHD